MPRQHNLTPKIKESPPFPLGTQVGWESEGMILQLQQLQQRPQLKLQLVGQQMLGLGHLPPPPPMGAVLPVASLGTISRAMWAKVPIGMRDQHAGQEMVNCLALIGGATPNPEAVTLSIATCSFEPVCFLTARETATTGIPTIELIH